MKHIFLLFLLILALGAHAQTTNNTELPYYQIPDNPKEYTATAVVARMVDGLGFRYYWGTEGLRPEDLAYRPSEEARSTEEIIDHLLGLTNVILNSVTQQPNVRSVENQPVLSFEEKRAKTLDNIKQASDILKSSSAKDLESFNLVFQRGENTTEYPFWNQINGPISDALWHVGQVVLQRRSSGNPFDSKVGVLVGKRRE